MSYLTCLHCEKRFQTPSKRRYCSILCKNAVAKATAKARLADDRHHETTRRQPTFNLTDLECLRIEAALAANEDHVFERKPGYSIKDGHQETKQANANELHDAWANRAADLNVWQLRVCDRRRYGGIVCTPELAIVQADVLTQLADAERQREPIDGLDSPAFHLKVWPDDLDKLFRSHLETSTTKYDRDLLKAELTS